MFVRKDGAVLRTQMRKGQHLEPSTFMTIVVFEVDPINANTRSGSQKTKASILGKKFNKG